MERRRRQSERIVNVGLICNVALALLKTSLGIVGGSSGLLADGVNSTSDVVYYGIVKLFMRLSSKPADRQHPYGHAQLETIAALVVGAFIVTTGAGIFWKAIGDLYEWIVQGGPGADLGVASLAAALFTVALKLVLTVATLRVARQTGHAALLALAYDHRNDIFSAAAVVLGIFFSRHGFPWVDPLAGALVAIVILKTGIVVLRESSGELMDTLPDGALAEKIRHAAQSIPGVQAAEEIHARRYGPYVVLNITVAVDGSISVAEGDRIASQVEESLTDRFDLVRRVYVHYHPAQSA
jgi:cation diffusion facilitator family transporter